ncbi:MAG: tetratricopeptide repeat protein [Candidatus Babeliaceae bacterium]|nr:tetratricopeptide repeat protein [Candidatus Babeliaceae bacterium]
MLPTAEVGLVYAENELKGAIRIDKSKPNAHANLGRVYYHQGHLDEAILEYKECLRLDPKHNASDAIRDLLQIAYDDKKNVNELERTKVDAWHEISETNVVRFWGISIWRMKQLMKEYEQLEIMYESLCMKDAQEKIDVIFTIIAKSKDLTLDQKAIADFALLAIVDGAIPTPRGVECIKIAFQTYPDLLETLLQRCSPSTN